MKAKLLNVIVAGLLMVLFSCNSHNDKINASEIVKNPNTADNPVNTENLPVFQFSEEEWDFGRITQGEVVEHIFKFTNVGKSDLIIGAAKASCGCTVAEYTKTPVKPGQSGQVAVKFDSEGRKGMNTKTVTLTANTQPNTKVLTIKAEVITPEK